MLKKKWFLIALGVVIFLVILIGVAQAVINNKLETLLNQSIESSLGPDYSVDILSTHFSFWKNKLTVDELELSKRHGSDYQWTITADNVKLKGFRAVGFLLGKGFGLDEIILDKPAIHMRKPGVDTTSAPSDTSQMKANDIKVDIGAIRCTGGTLTYDPDGPESFTTDFDFALFDIQFEGRLRKIERLWKNSGIQLSNCRYQFPDSVYTVTVDSILLPKSGDDVQLLNFRLESNISKTEFPKRFGWRKSRFEAHLPRMSIARPANFGDSLMVIHYMDLDSLHLEIHKDARYPWPDRVTKLPQAGLAPLNQRFKVDSVGFKNSSFTFISVFEDGEPSELRFTDISGALVHFQNMDTTAGKPAFTFRAESTFMDRTSLAMQTTYRYGSDDPFECAAQMGSTDLSFMSDFLQSAAGIRISQGRASKLLLELKGNNRGEYGYVDFYYNGLKLEAVDKETGQEKWLLNVVTDLARGVIFWKDNPEKDFRRGTFQKDRTRYKGFPSQWIEGLFAGILESVSKIDPGKIKRK